MDAQKSKVLWATYAGYFAVFTANRTVENAEACLTAYEAWLRSASLPGPEVEAHLYAKAKGLARMILEVSYGVA